MAIIIIVWYKLSFILYIDYVIYKKIILLRDSHWLYSLLN